LLEEKKKIIKEMVKRLHRGENLEKIKKEFEEKLGDTTPDEIALVEEELIKEGMSIEEVHRLCDVHLAAFKKSIEKNKPDVPPGHPINILLEEHKMVLNFAEKLRALVKKMKENPENEFRSEDVEELYHIVEHFRASESHYIREENVLFPYLEKHGVTQPPKVMWMEHDKIRETEKGLYRTVEDLKSAGYRNSLSKLDGISMILFETLSGHFYKENNILFPTALKLMSPQEWKDIRKQFDELGYCCFTPEVPEIKFEMEGPTSSGELKSERKEGMIEFETGRLSLEELETVLNTLPVDFTFVDREDRVRYFNDPVERIFPRTKAVLGRTVQNCHPQKSVHVVNQILKDFREGKRDKAEFWIQMGEKMIHIRYFPVRNKKGEYLGCLEVTQDITEIKKIEGEKRLLEE